MLERLENERDGGLGLLPLQARPASTQLAGRLQTAKASFVCRRVDLSFAQTLSRKLAPHAGDIVLARVGVPGHHSKLESPHGRRIQLYPEDEILLAYGDRYAPDQFEAVVPPDMEACDLVAAGGIAAKVVSRHSATRKATSINPIGLLLDGEGRPLNLSQFALSKAPVRGTARTVVGVVGTSMNAGKTTAATNLIHGLSKSGIRVGACKLTGTGSGGDLWSMLDAGAARAVDFTDAGYATTAGVDLTRLQHAATNIIASLEAEDIDVIVAEIADGLLQRETAALLRTPQFAARFDAFILAAADAMGALAGAEWLRKQGLPLRAITGLVTASPLASKEVAAVLADEIVDTKALSTPLTAVRVCLGHAHLPRVAVS